MLRPPARFTPAGLPGMTAPPPSTIRPPASDLVFKKSDDGDVTIEPAPKLDDAASTQPSMLRNDVIDADLTREHTAARDGEVTLDQEATRDGAAATQPRMLRDELVGGDATNDPTAARDGAAANQAPQRPGRPTRERDIDAPAVMRAFDHAESASTQPSMKRAEVRDDTLTKMKGAEVGDETSPSVGLPSIPVPDAGSSWGRGLAARLERQLEEDFGRETPTSPPTRAELQALMNEAPDATKQQSIEELERLHEQARNRESQPELELTRRAPHPTREIEEDDIESAIELAPSARRTAIGIAKKKPTGE
jgi:hypothetical protein